MNINIAFSEIGRKITGFFGRYHFLIFFVFIMSSLIAAMLIINVTVISYSDDSYVSQINNNGFDEETIERLRALKTNEESTDKLTFPGRISPF